jgi:DNA-binding MarR family transcriptional regulator
MFDWIYGLSNIADEQSREIEKNTGLSKNQALTIKLISHSTSSTFSELVKIMHLNPATMVRILNRLEDQGMISRTRSKIDRRVVKIELTENAKTACQALRKISCDSAPNLFVAIDTSKLVEMLNLLKELTAALESTRL